MTEDHPDSDPDDRLLEEVRSIDPIESTDEARSAVRAVAETLGERLTDGQAEELAATLPETAAEPLRNAEPGEAEAFGTKEFLERVHRRADVDAEPLPTVRAALAGIKSVAGETELAESREQLPGEFEYLFETGEPMGADEFAERVAARLPDDVDPRDAIDATLGTLARRITGGEAIDVSTYLPRELRDPLVEAEEEATEFDREEFLDLVADRSGARRNEAMDVARAVLAAVGEAAPEAELEKVRTQLPAEFEPLFDG